MGGTIRVDYRWEADWVCSLMASCTAVNSDGISFLFVTIMPVSRSRYLPFEKSKLFPAASVAIPPASAKYMKEL